MMLRKRNKLRDVFPTKTFHRRQRRPAPLRRHFREASGACPQPASSGKTIRSRLDRGGSRKANRALYRIVIGITPTNLSRLARGLEQNTTRTLDQLTEISEPSAAEDSRRLTSMSDMEHLTVSIMKLVGMSSGDLEGSAVVLDHRSDLSENRSSSSVK